ncbi:MAG: hypothetical protein AAB481_00780 [Patescibacteria group bacterium]
MTLEQEHILYVEGKHNSNWISMLPMGLSNTFEVQVVTTVAEARDILLQLSEGKRKFRAIILGGNIDGPKKPMDSPENDSQRILEQMRDLEISIPTIGFSGDPDPMPGVTRNFGKKDVNIFELQTYINSL